MDIAAQDISKNTRYRILIFRKIKISEIEKSPNTSDSEGAYVYSFPESFFKVSALEP